MKSSTSNIFSTVQMLLLLLLEPSEEAEARGPEADSSGREAGGSLQHQRVIRC